MVVKDATPTDFAWYVKKTSRRLSQILPYLVMG